MPGFRFYAILFCLTVTFGLQAALPEHQLPNEFKQTVRIGRGSVLDVEWHPGGDILMVDTIIGAWLYTAMLEDIAYLENGRLGTFSPDGHWLAGVDGDNNITLWEATTLEQVDTLRGHSNRVDALEWSPDGGFLASADNHRQVVVWNVETRQPSFQFSKASGSSAVMIWSPNGQNLALMNHDEEVWVWDATIGELQIQIPPTTQERTIYFSTILWIADSQHLLRAIGPFEGSTLEQWEIASGRLIAQHDVGDINDIAISPDGSRIAVVALDVTLWNASTFDLLAGLSHTEHIGGGYFGAFSASWSPDSRQIITSDARPSPSQSGTLRLWDAQTGAATATLEGGIGYIPYLVWTKDGKRLISIGDKGVIQIWDVEHQQMLAENRQHSNIGDTLAWNYDSSKIALDDTIDAVDVWDAVTGHQLAALEAHGQAVSEIAWQPGGRLLATRSGDYYWNTVDNNVRVWDVAQSSNNAQPLVVIPHKNYVAGIAWSPDGMRLASLERYQFIHIWSTDSQQPERIIDTFEIRLTPYIDYTQVFLGVEWSYAGDMLLVDYANTSSAHGCGGAAWVWNPYTGEIESGFCRFPAEVWTPANQLVWANWGGWGGAPPPVYDVTVGISYNNNPPTLPPSVTLSGLEEQVTHAVISPDGAKVVGFDTSNSGIVWAVRSRRALFTLDNASGAVWSPDGTTLAVFSPDHTVRIVDAWTGSVITSFEGYDGMQLFWSPDSRKFALLAAGVLFIYETA